MSTGDAYRIKAADLAASARTETHPDMRLELERLALFYLRLADQADLRPGYPAHDEHPTLQQQQPQARERRSRRAR